mmetsp:Transcript_56074/g.111443  ORF Transcript_56074/g.111443 Transcript_56074/m.111443 type:complete len:605 (-) Transcript_56074:161-1975(-)
MAKHLAAAHGCFCSCGGERKADLAAAAAAGSPSVLLRWRQWQWPSTSRRLSGEDRTFLRLCLGGWPSLAVAASSPGFSVPAQADGNDEQVNDTSSDTDEESSRYSISVSPACAGESADTLLGEPAAVDQVAVYTGDGETDEDDLCREVHFMLTCDSEDEVDGQTTMTPNSCCSLEAMFDSRWDLQQNGLSVADVTDDLDDPSEADEWRYDIEDEFDFDPDRVAEAIRRGADEQELTKVIQEAMAGALEDRLTGNILLSQDARATAATSGNRLMVPGAEPNNDSCEGSTSRVTGELGGLMTPTAPSGSETPSADAAASHAAAALDGEELQLRLQKAAAARTRRCPSFVPRLSKLPQLADAVRAQTARHRQSFARADALVENADLEEKSARHVRRSLASARSVRRQSLLKAAAILETATTTDVPEAANPTAAQDVDKQLRLVHRAMLSARESHRLSVVKAVDLAAQGHGRLAVETTEPTAPLPGQHLAQDRVTKVVSAAYARHKASGPKNGAPPAWTALMHMQKVEGRQPHFVHCGPKRDKAKKRAQKWVVKVPAASSAGDNHDGAAAAQTGDGNGKRREEQQRRGRGGTSSKRGGQAISASFGGS